MLASELQKASPHDIPQAWQDGSIGDAHKRSNRLAPPARSVAETAREEFDATSERWHDGKTGTRVRSRMMDLDAVDLQRPEAPDEPDADELEDAPAAPMEHQPLVTIAHFRQTD